MSVPSLTLACCSCGAKRPSEELMKRDMWAAIVHFEEQVGYAVCPKCRDELAFVSNEDVVSEPEVLN